MKAFREDIKEDVLMAAGTTRERYYKKRSLNPYDYDPIDEIVITVAGQLRRAHKIMFGMLYDCHSIPTSVTRLVERGHKPITEETARKYMRGSKAKVVENVLKDNLEKVKEVLRAEYDK